MQDVLQVLQQGAYPIVLVLGVTAWRVGAFMRRRQRVRRYLRRHAAMPGAQDPVEQWLVATAGSIWFAGQAAVCAELKPSMKVANVHHVATPGLVDESLHWQEFIDALQREYRFVIPDEHLDTNRTLGQWAEYVRQECRSVANG
jgi:hypothetical protein